MDNKFISKFEDFLVGDEGTKDNEKTDVDKRKEVINTEKVSIPDKEENINTDTNSSPETIQKEENGFFFKPRPCLDWDVYNYLMEKVKEAEKENKNIYFRPLKNFNPNKPCYIFHGNENYMAITFYKGGSQFQMVPSIFLNLKKSGKNDYNYYIELIYDKKIHEKSKNLDEKTIKCREYFIKEVRKLLKEKGYDFQNYSNNYVERYRYKIDTNNWKEAIDFFLNNIKPTIDGLIDKGVSKCSNCNFKDLFEISKDDFYYLIEKLEQKLKENNCSSIFKNDCKEQDYLTKNEKSSLSYDINLFPLNFILYGPPGTGKTYNTIKYAVAVIENIPIEQLENEDIEEVKERFKQYKAQGQIVFTTFHPSYSYEDFVEGLKAKVENGQVEYYIEDGIFKDICKKASMNISLPESLNNYKVNITVENIELINQQGSKIIIPKELIWDFINHINTSEENKERIFELLSQDRGNIGEQIVNLINTKYLASFIKRYQSQIKEILEEIEVERNKDKNYVLIIDEINRGNIPSIFGELITLIEEDKRLGNDLGFTVKLPYSKDDFGVPKNLYIIGTMNTADRSIALLDIALRRRFEFIEMMPQPELLKGIKVKKDDGSECDIKLNELLKKINERITKELNRDHQIGHAYFLASVKTDENGKRYITLNDLNRIFKNKIIPLLQEYFYDEWDTMKEVLNDKKREKFIKGKDFSEKLKNLNLTCDDFKCIYDNSACNGKQNTEDNNQTQENVGNSPETEEEQQSQNASETIQGEES